MFEGGISNATPQKQQSPLERVGNDASIQLLKHLKNIQSHYLTTIRYTVQWLK
jgi:hypothetical protein